MADDERTDNPIHEDDLGSDYYARDRIEWANRRMVSLASRVVVVGQCRIVDEDDPRRQSLVKVVSRRGEIVGKVSLSSSPTEVTWVILS